MQSYKYVDVAIGGPQNRNHLVTLEDLAKIDRSRPDTHATYFVYPEAMRTHMDEHGTVKGYDGPVFSYFLPFDIDDPDGDLSKALAITKDLLREIELAFDFPGSDCRIYFSGRKGFHVLIPHTAFGGFMPSEHLHRILKAMALKIGGDRIDKSIYDKVRLLRLTNTKHPKSGLYRIPLYIGELIMAEGPEHIIEMAKAPRTDVEFTSINEITPSETLKSLYVATRKEVFHQAEKEAAGIVTAGITIQQTGTPLACPKDEKPCIYRMLSGVVKNRNNAGLRIAAHFRKRGLPADMVMGIMLAWNRRNKTPLDAHEVEAIVKSAYSGSGYDFGCNDDELKKYCVETCKFREGGNVDPTKIYDAERALEAYRMYIRKLKEITFVTGIEEIDYVIRGVAPGEVLVMMGRPGTYKTALLQNMLYHYTSKSGQSALFFSLEMPIPSLVERYIALSTRILRPRDIEQTFAGGEAVSPGGPTPDELEQTYRQQLGRVIHIRDGAVSLDKVLSYVKAVEQMPGIESGITLVAIDYLQLMKSGKFREYENVTEISRNAKELALALNTPLIILSQTSRRGGDGSTEITMDMGRGSGAIEEAADFLFGLYRPDPESLVLKIAKNRKGPANRYYRLSYDPETFYFGEHAERYIPPKKPNERLF